MTSPFRASFSEDRFKDKYARGRTWSETSHSIVSDVCGNFQGKADPLLSADERRQLTYYIETMKFLPGGRYIYYSGLPMHAWNNCFLHRGTEDTREEWGQVIKRSSDCLMMGGGIGNVYSVFREKDAPLRRTGGTASGPIPLMYAVNEYGRNVMQGGSRRSAIWAGLHWWHGDIMAFLRCKNWHDMPIGKAKKRDGSPYTIADAKKDDFNFHAPLDMTNISVLYDDKWLDGDQMNEVFMLNCLQALMTGEPGFAFNFREKQNEVCRNACTEVTSEDDSDVCNLGSVNLANIDSPQELIDVTSLASKFLVNGTVRATLPYDKVYKVREKNRRLGLGLMGIHEWLLKRGMRYEVTPELHEWLYAWKHTSEVGANDQCDRLGISRPVAYRAIAPTGTIGILAGTTTGIEPLYAVAYKRRFLKDGTHWAYSYVIDPTADLLIRQYGLKPEEIETAASLAADPERRIKFQADVQDYVDMAISSTINLPPWGSELNNQDKVKDFAVLLAKYAPRLRGFTCYPDGSRGGQPITEIPYKDAVGRTGVEYKETDMCELGKGGICGM
jgi:ribonucleoside-diphosphate reductase alpha chain